ncbi:MAG: hypothetical protein QF704_09350, partial [Anaerolineales bacterium]|nr:hypothetical protein [Anaerolineales bacterium]
MAKNPGGKIKWLTQRTPIRNSRGLSDYLASSTYRKAVSSKTTFISASTPSVLRRGTQPPLPNPPAYPDIEWLNSCCCWGTQPPEGMTVDLWDDNLGEMVTVPAVCESYSTTATGCYCALNPGSMASYGFGPICTDWQNENLESANCPGGPTGGEAVCSEFCSPNPACGGFCDHTLGFDPEEGVWMCQCGEWDFDPPGQGDEGNEQGASGQWPVCDHTNYTSEDSGVSCTPSQSRLSHITSYINAMHAPIDALVNQPLTHLQPFVPIEYTMAQIKIMQAEVTTNPYMTQQNAGDGGGDFDVGPGHRWCWQCGGACPCIGNGGYTEQSLYCYKNSNYDNQTDGQGVPYWDGGPNFGNAVYTYGCAPWYWFENYETGQGGSYCAPNCPSPHQDVFGCTDANAENYNSDATDDDGTCWYVTNYANAYGGGSVPTTR